MLTIDNYGSISDIKKSEFLKFTKQAGASQKITDVEILEIMSNPILETFTFIK